MAPAARPLPRPPPPVLGSFLSVTFEGPRDSTRKNIKKRLEGRRSAAAALVPAVFRAESLSSLLRRIVRRRRCVSQSARDMRGGSPSHYRRRRRADLAAMRRRTGGRSGPAAPRAAGAGARATVWGGCSGDPVCGGVGSPAADPADGSLRRSGAQPPAAFPWSAA